MSKKNKYDSCCVECGKDLPHRYTVCKECADKSKFKYDVNRIFTGEEIIHCVLCGKEISSKNRRSKSDSVCSVECWNSLRRKKYKESKGDDKTYTKYEAKHNTPKEDYADYLIDRFEDD